VRLQWRRSPRAGDGNDRVWNTVGVLALGALGWFVTSFVGRPLRDFFDLRREVIHKSVLYDNVMGVERESPDGHVEQVEITADEFKRLQEAQNAFRDLASRMRAFALNEHLAVWLVKWRYDPWEASDALLRVSNTLPKFGGARADAKSKLEQALGFRITR
jgi:HAMP domain-containing protein